jgi:hypothetical protein
MTTSHTLNAVERAYTDLVRDGRPVTFTAVATTTGLSRSTLYRNPALRALVDHHQHRHHGPITAITDENRHATHGSEQTRRTSPQPRRTTSKTPQLTPFTGQWPSREPISRMNL